MNNYTRMIGSLLILTYSLAVIFFLLDRIFVNIIYFQGMFYTQIVGVPAILFLNVIVILACIIMGSILAYRQNEQYSDIQEMISRLGDGEKITLDNLNQDLEVIEIMKTLENVSTIIEDVKRQNQLVINDVHTLNEETVKQIVEEERQRLARELHDSVSQQLFAASMMLSALKSANHAEQVSKQLNLLEKMLHESQLEMRALLLHLRPVGLKNKTLEQGLIQLIKELKQKIPLNINADIEEIKLEKGVEDHLFRIAQESISNTLRHAKAENITIELFRAGNRVILRVTDDGLGFDINQIDDTRYGLHTMKERALEIGGTCHVISAPQSGTRIEVKVPIKEE
ncbi:sensor histidine kinase [Macrococcoides bohemicum]|uniref:Sensor histidine kinase n=1 Tax=Macrococcoides bohemicum TaxID=1903056 RepID=A0A4V3B0Q2_9STAP|nr:MULTISPECIES: sensor histidine kinase [Macrococcus]ATD29788.1 two-component sensor histidine kinase [Macrococcus sp. IME1552]MBC9875048.1 sensor histidine kinase [Macrococcus bohemicus]QRN50516.1 sensor histidine kinase [Macrococcus bohemicus]QYA41937.1 sensor histidine kinase [Macrococcus bohemicus]QYA44360.1 sensor histidine kinase [Macrococcus bohemicus]